MSKRVRSMMAAIWGVPETMDPQEMEERVEVLEAAVEANRLQLQEHEQDRFAHKRDEGESV